MIWAEKVLFTVAVMVGINSGLALILILAEALFLRYGVVRVKINNEERSVEGGSSLLATLAQEKIFIPSACGGRGTCGYCKCKIIEGGGPLLPTEASVLTGKETEAQLRLACQIKVKGPMAIVIPEELLNIKSFKARIESIQILTHTLKNLRLQLVEPETISFKPGQYIQLKSEPYGSIRECVSRAYSISSNSADRRHVELIIQHVPDGICSTWVHQHLNEGEEVEFTGPMGEFYLREGQGEIIMIAGGSGIAPIVSILWETADKQISRKITFFYGARAMKDLFYLKKMEEFEEKIPDFTFVPSLSNPDPGDNWQGKTGWVTEHVENYLKDKDTSDMQAYLCGSPGMVQASVSILEKYGMKSSNIFYDPFA